MKENVSTTQCFFLCIISLAVLSYVENQKVQNGRKLTWKRSEVLAWHIPLPDTVHSLFSSKMKPCYTVPMRKSSRESTNKTTIKHNSRQFLQLRMFKMSTFTTFSLLKFKIKKSQTYYSSDKAEDKVQGNCTCQSASWSAAERGQVHWGAIPTVTLWPLAFQGANKAEKPTK